VGRAGLEPTGLISRQFDCSTRFQGDWWKPLPRTRVRNRACRAKMAHVLFLLCGVLEDGVSDGQVLCVKLEGVGGWLACGGRLRDGSCGV